MAKRMKSKIQPAVEKFYFNVTHVTGGADQYQYIDLSQCASIMNRRFYRQGLNWAVAGFRVFTPTIGATEIVNTGSMTINKLPNTWVLSNAWEKSFRAYMKMIKEALSESESTRPKFLDFKIHMNERHHDKDVANNLLPIDSDLNVAQPGEWTPSRIEVPSGQAGGQVNEFEFVAVGPNYGSTGGKPFVSLINGYANSRALPQVASPHTPDDMDDTIGPTPENWMQAIFNEGTQQSSEVLEDLELHYNENPYPILDQAGIATTMYPGGETQLPALQRHDAAFITSTTLGATTTLMGGNFPCGLIEIGTNMKNNNAPLIIELNLVPGEHRGYLAEPMTEM